MVKQTKKEKEMIKEMDRLKKIEKKQAKDKNNNG